MQSNAVKPLSWTPRIVRTEADLAESPAGAPPMLSADMTAMEGYERYVLPVCRSNSDPKTVKQDQQTLSYWSQATGDPPLRGITPYTGADFIAFLAKQPGQKKGQKLSPNTVRKHKTHMQFILDRFGIRTRRNPLGLNLFLDDRGFPCEAPALQGPKKRLSPATKNLTLDEISRWMAACEFATPTKNLLGQEPTAFHRSLITFVYNTGLRIDTTMELTWPMLDRSRPGWIEIPADVYKGGSQGFSLYVNPWARAAAESIRTKHEKLFPWEGWPDSQNWLQACRRKIMAKTAIPEHRRYGFHGLRRALGTWVAPQNPMLAKIILGHRGGDVTQDYYVNPDVMQEMLDRVPQPGRISQKSLF